MSSDESSHVTGYPCYKVFKKHWRNPTISLWLRLFDSIYRRLRFNEVEKNTPGAHPHMRLYTDEVSTDRPPVKGLPRNAYNDTWYNSLNEFDRQQLAAQPETYDFSHPDELTRLASAYNLSHNPLGLFF
ncbi:hypothetical protein FKP32DRAFT_1671811 [Trametes sanguinea]|nr:hypothetical protein FKP32DRAFT_1671811 [Trametes sanguinea]